MKQNNKQFKEKEIERKLRLLANYLIDRIIEEHRQGVLKCEQIAIKTK